MKKNFLTALITLVTVFSSVAQTPEEIYAVASKDVQTKMDENKKNGDDLLKGIAAKHVFKVDGPVDYTIADLDVQLIEAPGMIDYAMNLSVTWSIKSVEFEYVATFTLDQIKAYLAEVNVTITKDKVMYVVQS